MPGGAWPSQAFAEQQKCNTRLTGTSFLTFLSEQLKEKLMSLPGQSFAALLLAGYRPEWWMLSRVWSTVPTRRWLHTRLYSISCSRECFRDLLGLAELRVVMGGGGLAPLTPHPCQCHSQAFCGGVAFGQMREGSDLLSGHVVARSEAAREGAAHSGTSCSPEHQFSHFPSHRVGLYSRISPRAQHGSLRHWEQDGAEFSSAGSPLVCTKSRQGGRAVVPDTKRKQR